MVRNRFRFAALAIAVLLCILAVGLRAQSKATKAADGEDVTILVTVDPHNERERARATALKPGDFGVREDGRPQKILSVRRALETPTTVAVLIQDDLVSRVDLEIRGIADFIRGLPEGSRVMTGYLTVGDLNVAQEFTTDRERAAKSLRIVRSTRSAAPYNPYVGLIAALRRFDSQPEGRRMVLMISDGLDLSHGFSSASPTLSIDLDRAIGVAQREGVSVFAFYAPSVGLGFIRRLEINFGQGSLNRLADETGGEAFFSGTDFVSFHSYWQELKDIFNLQWVITYRSSSQGSGFRRIEVTTEPGLHVQHPRGYRARSDA